MKWHMERVVRASGSDSDDDHDADTVKMLTLRVLKMVMTTNTDLPPQSR